jgi:hypothetical protein
MSDIYAEFGVNNAVISGGTTQEEHEQNMLALDVRARDGDHSIELNGEEDDSEDPLEEEGEEGEEETGTDDEEDDGEPLGAPDAELEATSKNLEKYADGFSHMREQAIANGLPEAMAQSIEAEYDTDEGISDKSYEALAKAGYSREFVESYIQGQEAVTEQYVAKIVEFSGGQQKFQQVIKHLEATSPDSVESFYEALERQDLKAVRTILSRKFGKAPERNVVTKAPAAPQQRKSSAAEGYPSSAEMIKAMSSSEYRNDPKYRAKVEARVAASSF